MRKGLAKSESGIDNESLSCDTRIPTGSEALLKKFKDIFDDIPVGVGLLHRARLPLHVHETDGDI